MRGLVASATRFLSKANSPPNNQIAYRKKLWRPRPDNHDGLDWCFMVRGKGAMASVLVLVCGFTGCTDTLGTPSLTSRDPLLKVPAIKSAAVNDDRSNEAQMVADLSSDDAAIRFYSIQGLSRLTGNTYGYHYYDNDEQRRAAVDRWKAWLAIRPSAKAAAVAATRVDRSTGGWTTGE